MKVKELVALLKLVDGDTEILIRPTCDSSFDLMDVRKCAGYAHDKKIPFLDMIPSNYNDEGNDVPDHSLKDEWLRRTCESAEPDGD